MEKKRNFPDWKQLYSEEDVENMPWFYPGLDPDLESALQKHNIKSGRALDLGTGPATQAIALAERDFHVTATDLSEAAIQKARILAEERGLTIDFRQDDILDCALQGPFDLIFDRGLFHVLPPETRKEYVPCIFSLLHPGGFLFLKCFSHRETMDEGPYRFTPGEIRTFFEDAFTIHSIDDTEFHGTLDTFPKALFATLQKPGT